MAEQNCGSCAGWDRIYGESPEGRGVCGPLSRRSGKNVARVTRAGDGAGCKFYEDKEGRDGCKEH